MANEIFILRFEIRDGNPGDPYEEQEYTIAADAWDAFRLFAEPDSSEMYTKVELVKYSFETGNETPLAQMCFEINPA